MRRLNIRLFGSFQVFLDGCPLTTFETDKTRALLAYLAVEADRSHRRESLSTLFWPNLPEAGARNNLRQTLFRLRQAIGDGLLATPHLLVDVHTIQVNPAGDHWLDVAEFSDQLNASRLHRRYDGFVTKGCRDCLRAAIALYHGDLLTGFSLPGCADFDWWLLASQERYHRQALEALELLGRSCEEERDYAQSASCAEKEIALEPWLEAAHRRKMRALALSGQMRAAMIHYRRFSRPLAEELEAVPSAATTGLYEEIRAGRMSAAHNYAASDLSGEPAV